VTEPASASGSDSSPDKKKKKKKKKRDRGNNPEEGADEAGSDDRSPAQKKRKIDERTDQKDYLGLKSLYSDSYRSGSDCNPRPHHRPYVVHEGQRNPQINTNKQCGPQLPPHFRK